MEKPVWIGGVGMISAIGNSVPEALQAIEQGKSGIGPMRWLPSAHKDVFPVAEVKLSNGDLADYTGMPCGITRTALLGVAAATEAFKSIEHLLHPTFKTGLLSATTVGGMDKTTHFFKEFLKNQSGGRLRNVVYHECGSPTELVAEKLGIRDFITTISTACSSSANSIMMAARMIQHGMLDVAIAGGVDALSTFTLNGFNTLMILDKAYCRPFDNSRNGLNLGEGAAFLVLLSESALKTMGIEPLCRISGWHNATDAYHQTASSPDGIGSCIAMRGALEKARLQPEDIGYINVHGTGTVNNDQSEGTAMKQIFGEKMPRFSSSKSFTGHTLGASGGVEAVLSVLALKHGLIYPNLRFSTPIEGLGLVPETHFQTGVDIRHVLSNSFGFGGNCTSLLFSKN